MDWGELGKIPIQGIYYGPTVSLPNGEVMCSGDILVPGTAKWDAAKESGHAWFEGNPMPTFNIQAE